MIIATGLRLLPDRRHLSASLDLSNAKLGLHAGARRQHVFRLGAVNILATQVKLERRLSRMIVRLLCQKLSLQRLVQLKSERCFLFSLLVTFEASDYLDRNL